MTFSVLCLALKKNPYIWHFALAVYEFMRCDVGGEKPKPRAEVIPELQRYSIIVSAALPRALVSLIRSSC